MTEAREHAALVEHRHRERLIVREVRQHALHDDASVEAFDPRPAREEDLGHPTAPESSDHPQVADACRELRHDRQHTHAPRT